MSTKIEKIRFAIMHNPTLIPALLRDTSVNKGLIYRELRKALPCRIGIEFEMGANFRVGFQKKYNPKATDADIAKHYGVLEVRCDDTNISLEQALRRRRELQRLVDNSREHPGMDEPSFSDSRHDDCDKLIESRVSIKDYSQLAGLYKFMQDLPEFCTLHEGGGIHIHINMAMFPYTNKTKEKEVQNWLTNRLDEIGNLFPEYTGKYNQRRIGVRTKATWLNMSNKHTLEFRTPPLTFDYYTLMTWIVGIVKFRNKLIHECKLKANWVAPAAITEDITEILVDSNTTPDQLVSIHNQISNLNNQLEDLNSTSGYDTQARWRLHRVNDGEYYFST